MSDWLSIRRSIIVYINGVVVPATSEVTLNESLDTMSRTATFLLAAQPDPQPAEQDTVLIQFYDDGDHLVYPIFGGTINTLEVESEPWAYSVIAVDQLEKTRATNKGGDTDLSDVSDGTAWKILMTYCGVTYDNADVADTGYNLGQHEPVWWHDDSSTPAASVIQELDNIFGMATMTIGDNRVIRVPVDFVPDDDLGLYRSYTKGSDADWQSHHRSRGNRDSIQNVWSVTGASIESSDGSCTATPWALAVAGNAQLGRRVRAASASISSDFIQDESLAAAIVRRQMRRFNRPPDRASIAMSLDANLHPAAKVKLIDHTYGINTGSGRYCLVTSVGRSGLGMTAELECGAAGSEGTVTHGVNKVCGDNQHDSNIEDGFTPADFDYPPIDDGDDLDISDIFDEHERPWSSGGPVGDCGVPTSPLACTLTAYSTGVTVEPNRDWSISGIVTLTADTQALTLGVDTDEGFYRFRLAGGAFYDPLIGAYQYELLTPFTSHRLPGYAPIHDDLIWKIMYNSLRKRLIFYVDVGTDICFSDEIDVPDANMGSAVTWESVTGSPSRTSQFLNHNCIPGSAGGTDLRPDPITWGCGVTDIGVSAAWTMSADDVLDREA